jgi:hypothetical protein
LAYRWRLQSLAVCRRGGSRKNIGQHSLSFFFTFGVTLYLESSALSPSYSLQFTTLSAKNLETWVIRTIVLRGRFYYQSSRSGEIRLLAGWQFGSLLCVIASFFPIQKAKRQTETEERGKKTFLCSFLCRMRVCMYGLSFFITHKCLFSFSFRLYMDTCLNSGDRSLWKKFLSFRFFHPAPKGRLGGEDEKGKRKVKVNERNATFRNSMVSLVGAVVVAIVLLYKSAFWK